MSDCAIKLKNHVSKEVKIVAPQIASNFVSTANVGLGSNYVEVRFESREVGDSQQYPLQAANELERQIISTYPELSKNITIKNSTIQNAKILKLIFPDKIAEKIVDRLDKEQQEQDEIIAEESKPKVKTEIKPGVQGLLFGEDSNNLDFSADTINTILTFVDAIGVNIELTTFEKEDTLAAANFLRGTIQIAEDLNKRPKAWNKLPEEAAHWWYRLLKKDTALKQELWNLAQKSPLYKELVESNYGNYNNVNDLTEETIGQLIAESIKRIEEKKATLQDKSFWTKFLDFINSILNSFKKSSEIPFDTAAAKILASDVSELMSIEEYKSLLNQASGEVIINNISEQVENETSTEVAQDVSPEYLEYLFNKKFKIKSRYLPKTIFKLQESIKSTSNALTKEFKDDETKDFKDVKLTFYSKFELFKKFKNGIPLNQEIKLDTAKKDEILIINYIKDKIKSENPELKSIDTNEFIKEVENYINTLFNLKETRLAKNWDNYRLANLIDSKTKGHIKMGVYLNNEYFPGGHWGNSPFAWYNITPYNGDTEKFNSVLLHEFQTDFLDTLDKYLSGQDTSKMTKDSIIISFLTKNDKYFQHLQNDITSKNPYKPSLYQEFKHKIDEFSYVYNEKEIKSAKHNFTHSMNALNSLYSDFRVIEDYFTKNKELLKEFANSYFNVEETEPNLKKQKKLEVIRFYGDKFAEDIKVKYNREFLYVIDYLKGAVNGKFNVNNFLSNATNRNKNKYVLDRLGAAKQYKENNKLKLFKLINGKEKYDKLKLLKEKEFEQIYNNLLQNYKTLDSLLNIGEDDTKNKAEFYKKFTDYYLVPLFHTAIQNSRNSQSKPDDIRFAGGRATFLSQGNLVTAELYAGPEEVEQDKSKSLKILKEVIEEALKNVTHITNPREDYQLKHLYKILDVSSLEDSFKHIKDYRKEAGVHGLDRLYQEVYKKLGNKFIRTGPIYTAFSKTKGIKLSYETSPGLVDNVPTYKVNLDNYILESPILYGIDKKQQKQTITKELEFLNNNEIFSPEMLEIVKNNHPQLQDGATQLEIQFFNNIKDKNCK